MAADPQAEFSEQVAYYKLKGFSADEAQMIVTRLTQHPDIYLYEMMRDEFGIDPRMAENAGLRAPIAMGASFAAGSLIPIAAFLLPVSMTISTIGSLVCAVVVFRRLLRGNAEQQKPIREGIGNRSLRLRVFALSYLAGHDIPPLFGHVPIAVGGEGARGLAARNGIAAETVTTSATGVSQAVNEPVASSSPATSSGPSKPATAAAVMMNG